MRWTALVFLVACGGSKPHEPAPAQPQPAAAEPAASPAPAGAVNCDDACTTYAVCYEEEYSRDYHGGGECVSSCEDMAPPDRQAWAAQIDATATTGCHALFAE